MRVLRTASALVTAMAAVLVLTVQPAAAGTTATPNPATPGESVTMTYNDKLCAVDWQNLVNNNIGVLVVDWPDGTQTLVDPVTDPVVVTVPAGMTAGTANISLHKGAVGNGEYVDCRGAFTVAEDATVPVFDPSVAAALGVAALGVTVIARRRPTMV